MLIFNMWSKIPISLTYFIIAVIPFFVFAFFLPTPEGNWISCFIFVLAAFTDYLDGKLARSMNQESKLGSLLDPIADKIIVTVALVLLIHDGTISNISLYAAMIIISREILVSGLREFLAKLQVSLPVSSLAKVKTTLQMISISILLAGDPGNELLFGFGMQLGILTLWISAAITVITGYSYFAKGLKYT